MIALPPSSQRLFCGGSVAKKNGVTAQVRTVICVEISGRKTKGGSSLRLREDDGLVGEFLSWCSDNAIFAAVTAGHTAPGSYIGFFDEKDADRVKEWFRKRGSKNI